MNISMQISDFAPERLICLARALKLHYSDRDRIRILMFSSYAAARNYTTPIEVYTIGPRVTWSWHNHAIYSLDVDEREESLTIMPIGQIDFFATTIKFPPTSTTPCTLEIAGRCLLALDDVTYPEEALRAKSAGAVTLEGVIDRNGRVKHLGAFGAEGPTGGVQSLLARAAIQNLKTWRFEPARQQAPIRITYEYVIDRWEVPRYPDNVRFDLPRKVEIRGRPPK